MGGGESGLVSIVHTCAKQFDCKHNGISGRERERVVMASSELLVIFNSTATTMTGSVWEHGLKYTHSIQPYKGHRYTSRGGYRIDERGGHHILKAAGGSA